MLFCGNCATELTRGLNNSAGKIKCSECGTEVPTFRHNSKELEFSLYCPGCGSPNYFSVRIGNTASCSNCWFPISLPDLNLVSEEEGFLVKKVKEEHVEVEIESGILKSAEKTIMPNSKQSEEFCAICQTSISVEEILAAVNCPDCNSPFHKDCWEENQGCAIYGCSQVPETEHLQSIEIPTSYWGQEHKSCPECEGQILAAAIRCRHCGIVLYTANPLEQNEYLERKRQRKKLPSLRKRVIWYVACCILPFTAPLAALIVLFWYRKNEKDIKELPSLYDGLSKIGIGIAILQTILLIVILMFYSFSNDSNSYQIY